MYQDRFIPYAHQSISQEDIDAVVAALKQELITRGPQVKAFEEALAAYCGAKYAVCMSSATAGLYAAFQAADVSAQDRVITTPNSFIATTAACMRLGAKPHFIDIEHSTGNMSLDCMKEAVAMPYSRGRFIICPVHFAGVAIDMQRLDRMLKTPDVCVIEDAAHALGSYYPSGEKVGSCAYSQMTVFSFHAIKTITCGEGGCVTTNDEALYHRLRRFRDSGIERDEAYLTQMPDRYYYEVQELSGNFHMTEMQAALGLSQLGRLEQCIEKRRQIVAWYRKHLKAAPNITCFGAQSDAQLDARTCYHLMCVHIAFDALAINKSTLGQKLADAGIGTQYHYIPLYRHPLLTRQYADQQDKFPEMERYYKEALSLPLFVDLEEVDVIRICDAIKRATKK